jgi:serine/threonine protein kinase
MSAPTLAIGTILAGRYTVHALLGRRQGRATYHCITAPNRHVAVKLLDPELANGEAQAALAQAAAAASELPEGAVLPVVDRGVDPETGAPFFVSPLSDHPSLEAFVSLCPLSLQEMATMARSLARGLDAAHRRGLAHLALRPTNVFVGPPPVCWTRVADFGAGAVDRVLGLGDERDTVAFAAPELYVAAPTALTAEGAARADVFSAALLCFYAATGDTYWKATRRKGGAPASAGLAPLVQEANGVRAPASVAARDIGATWSPSLDAAFARALSSAPAARFGSVGELADALADALQLPARGGAAGLADSLVRGEPAPQTMRDDDDDEPATRLAPPTAAPRAVAIAASELPSVAPPPESIAPTGPRTTATHARPAGLGGTMILEAGSDVSPPAKLVSKVPPPAAVPAFGPSAAPGPLPPPHPSLRPAAPVPESEAAAAPSRSRAPLVVGGVAMSVLALGAALFALRGGAGGGGATSAPTSRASPASSSSAAPTTSPEAAVRSTAARPGATAAPSASGTAAGPPMASASPDADATAAPMASASAAPTASASAGPLDPPPEGPIPTTYGLQPKPKVEQLDPPTTWYAELVVSCEPKCDLVLVQGGPTTNPEIPKQLPPGVYTVTVRQSGGIQSQGAVLRAATRTTLTFDGRLALPEER